MRIVPLDSYVAPTGLRNVVLSSLPPGFIGRLGYHVAFTLKSTGAAFDVSMMEPGAMLATDDMDTFLDALIDNIVVKPDAFRSVCTDVPSAIRRAQFVLCGTDWRTDLNGATIPAVGGAATSYYVDVEVPVQPFGRVLDPDRFGWGTALFAQGKWNTTFPSVAPASVVLTNGTATIGSVVITPFVALTDFGTAGDVTPVIEFLSFTNQGERPSIGPGFNLAVVIPGPSSYTFNSLQYNARIGEDWALAYEAMVRERVDNVALDIAPLALPLFQSDANASLDALFSQGGRQPEIVVKEATSTPYELSVYRVSLPTPQVNIQTLATVANGGPGTIIGLDVNELTKYTPGTSWRIVPGTGSIPNGTTVNPSNVASIAENLAAGKV